MKKLTKNDFIEKAIKIHGNKYDYSSFEYSNVHSKSKIICPNHGIFFQSAHDHKIGIGCPSCVNVKRLTTEEFIYRANIKHNKEYDYSITRYKNFRTKIKIKCYKHGEFLQSPINHLNGSKCPKCSRLISKKEIDFLNYLKIPNNENYRQKSINGIKVDAVVDNKIFEFLGDYWHGNPRRHKPEDYNKTCKRSFGKLYENTFNRFNILKKYGYKIYYIWEMDWNGWKNGIIKTFPIKVVSQQN